MINSIMIAVVSTNVINGVYIEPDRGYIYKVNNSHVELKVGESKELPQKRANIFDKQIVDKKIILKGYYEK